MKKVHTEMVQNVHDLKLYDILVIHNKMYIVKHFVFANEINYPEELRDTIWLHCYLSGEVERRKFKHFQASIELKIIHKLKYLL